ncbi:MAG: response regulator [Thermodesulfobacteriota bacterium]
MKVLVVEDNAATRKLLETLLTKWGYWVEAAGDGKRALEIVNAPDPPRLILLDWVMPGMDGIELCRRIRSSTSGAETGHIIILTARGEKKDIVEGLQAGADDYVVKPFDSGELRVRINAGKRIIELHDALDRRGKIQGVLEMAGAVCHEMNQPLQTITGYLDLIMMEMADPHHPLIEKLQIIKEQINRMGGITRKLMRITTYETREYMEGTKIIDIDKSASKDKGHL